MIWIILYNLIFNPLTFLVILPFTLFSTKARETVSSRMGLWKRLHASLKQRSKDKKLFWVHVASAGEYLQAKPVIENLLQKDKSVFVSVASISGYNWIKKDELINNPDLSFEYLPLDFIHNSYRIINTIKPEAIIFIRTDLWPNLIWTAGRKKVQMYLICASLNIYSSKYNSRYARSLFRSVCKNMEQIYCVSRADQILYREVLHPYKGTEILLGGDTKIESVWARSRNSAAPETDYQGLIKAMGHYDREKTIVLGSIWQKDMSLLVAPLKKLIKNHDISLIIAPHEPGNSILQHLQECFQEQNPCLWSEYKNDPTGKCRCLIVDTTGELFYFYKYAFMSYIGGGFGSGIHNILEAAVQESAVIMGPRYEKFREAVTLVESGGVRFIESGDDFMNIADYYLKHPDQAKKQMRIAEQFIFEHKNTSEKYVNSILGHIAEI